MGSTLRLRIPLYLLALVIFVSIVSLRGGPAIGDSGAVTRPAAALSEGNLIGAAKASMLPQPPGYALLASSLVEVLRPFVGNPTWCDARVPAMLGPLWPACEPGERPSHRWYRSQAALGVLAWLGLALGATSLLRAAGIGGRLAEAGLVLGLAVVPAADASLVETFHPQDLACMAFAAAATAQALRRRWVLAGVLFGAAFLCKQFALLPLVALLAFVPGPRQATKLLVPAVVVVAVGVLPFVLAAPGETLSRIAAIDSGNVKQLTTGTLLGMTPLPYSVKLLVARDAPVLLSLVVALCARWRHKAALQSPVALLGLVTACLATRLVFEVWFAGYYLLGVSVMLLALDLACRRPPVASAAWIVATTILVERSGGLAEPSYAVASLCMAAAVVAVFVGMLAVVRGEPPRQLSAVSLGPSLRSTSRRAPMWGPTYPQLREQESRPRATDLVQAR